MKIRERLSLQFSMLACALLFIAALILYFFASESAENYFDNVLRLQVRTTFSLWNNVAKRNSAELLLIDRNRQDRLPGEKKVIMDATGAILYNSNDSVSLPSLEPYLTDLDKTDGIAFDYGDHRVVGLKMLSDSKEVFYIFTWARPDANTTWLQQLRFLMVSIFVMMVAIIALTGWVFSYRAL
ncbi:MAG: Histidine kinase, partial [Bacteroidota bacterium]